MVNNDEYNKTGHPAPPPFVRREKPTVHIPSTQEETENGDKIYCDNCLASIILCLIYFLLFVIWGVISLLIPSFEFEWQRGLMGLCATVFTFATIGLPIPGIACGVISLVHNISGFRHFINKSKAAVLSIVCGSLNLICIGIVVWYISAWFNM